MSDNERQRGKMNSNYELAVKSPEAVVETATEAELRIRAEQLYYQSGGRALSGVTGYEAGWKAAKAYYEASAAKAVAQCSR